MVSTLTVVLCVFDVPLFAFHVSMIAFLLAQALQKGNDFRQGFFVLYIVVSIADCLYIFHVRLSLVSARSKLYETPQVTLPC